MWTLFLSRRPASLHCNNWQDQLCTLANEAAALLCLFTIPCSLPAVNRPPLLACCARHSTSRSAHVAPRAGVLQQPTRTDCSSREEDQPCRRSGSICNGTRGQRQICTISQMPSSTQEQR